MHSDRDHVIAAKQEKLATRVFVQYEHGAYDCSSKSVILQYVRLQLKTRNYVTVTVTGCSSTDRLYTLLQL